MACFSSTSQSDLENGKLQLTHFRLNDLSHTLRCKSPISVLGMPGSVLKLFDITKTRLFKNIENFTTKKGKFLDKKF